jgi:hypothetical protein
MYLELIGTDPDRHALDADPDQAKLCGSDPIHNNARTSIK